MSKLMEYVRKWMSKGICPHGFEKPGYCSECNFD